MAIDNYRLNPQDLSNKCRPSFFRFRSTAEVDPLKGIIGQDRAVRSLGFALDIGNEGYNVYLSGYFGTGRTTLALDMLNQKAASKPIPDDWCYVHNFKNHEIPNALSLPAGMGMEFKQDVAEIMDSVFKHIVKAFEGQEFDFQKNAILNQFAEETNQLYLRLEEEARGEGFTISRTPSGVISIPLKENGEQLTQEEYEQMTEETRAELMKKSAEVQEKINEAFRHYKELEKKAREKIKSLEIETARMVAVPDFNPLFEKYDALKEIVAYLHDLHQDVLNNLDMLKSMEEDSPANLLRRLDRRALVRKYQVNLVVDNSKLKNAPVVYETNPTFSNLFGQIEFESEFGVLTTDFSRIQAGSIHRANGGYLVLNVFDIIKNFIVWDKLKRVLKNKEIVVESMSKTFGWGNAETLQPEAIPIELKLILIGDPFIYYQLFAYDEEFQKLFKIRADFDVEMDRTPQHVREYSRFVSSVCSNKKLRHFIPAAVAEVVDYGSRMADDQAKLTTLFNRLVEIVYEANSWAGIDKEELVTREHVRRAIAEKDYRAAMLDEKMQELIEQGTIMIDVSGTKVGQLNGLSVYQVGDHQFGKPMRITAKTFMGEKGIVNIEREVHLSGNIYNKGVLTLNGYLGAQYAQDRPLSLSASVTIEQSYSGIEGDSASSAELYALLSSLAEVPLNQGIAVTGSVNQNGEIQPIGGVNHKIEGFFRVCKALGLTGEQGVIIPRQNVKNLMLSDELIGSVRRKMFNVWAVEHINEGLEILTGVPAGEKTESGEFPPGSIHYLVSRKLGLWGSRTAAIMGGATRNRAKTGSLIRRPRR